MIRSVKLEEIVGGLFDRGSFSRNGMELSLDDYVDYQSLDQDWIYFLARDIELSKEQLKVATISRSINPIRLYQAIPENHQLKKRTNMPKLPQTTYFKLIELIEKDFQRYRGNEGYVQLARDLRTEIGSAANLSQVWSGAAKYRNRLGWSGMINLPLDVFDSLERMLEEDVQKEKRFRKYQGDEGYVRLARDLRAETGRRVHPMHIWSGSFKYRSELEWSGRTVSPSGIFGADKKLIKNNGRFSGVINVKRLPSKKYKNSDSYVSNAIKKLIGKNFELYEGDEGYVGLIMDLKEDFGISIHPRRVWHLAEDHRERLGWSRMIDVPVEDLYEYFGIDLK